MVLKLEDKKRVVEEVASVASRAVSACVADYRGLSVSEITALRNLAVESGIYLKVVRNTLARRAVEHTNFACIQEVLSGPVLLAFSESDDPGAIARLFKEYIRDHEKLVVRAISLEGKLLPAERLDAVAQLPTRDQAIATLMSVLNAPITQLVRTMAEPYAMLVRTVAAVRDRKSA